MERCGIHLQEGIDKGIPNLKYLNARGIGWQERSEIVSEGGKRKGKGLAQERMVVVRRAAYPRKDIDEEIPNLKSRKYRASRSRERSKTVLEEGGMVAQPILRQFR